jgi:hypothetical protein
MGNAALSCVVAKLFGKGLSILFSLMKKEPKVASCLIFIF